MFPARFSVPRLWHAAPRLGQALCAGLLALALGVASRDEPRPKLERARAYSVRVEDREGRRLAELTTKAGGFRRPVTLDQISPHLVAATLSGEDAHFYYHPGIDPVGVARALWLDVRGGRFAYGGSTITQQLAKLVDPEPRTLAGKAREALDALRLEWELGKEEILTEYLNRAYYGRGATGAEAAASRFFGKTAGELTLGEAALLASLPRAPSAYDPDRHLGRALERRRHVLETMAERGWISRDAARVASRESVGLVHVERDVHARHVVDHIIAHGPAGPVVRTTIDRALQDRVEQAVRAHLAELGDDAVDQAGVVVLDNASGDVLAMVGSRRYGERAVSGAVNVTTALRAPGSTLKPFVYALALEGGDAPSTAVLDVPTERAGYRPRSASGAHAGLVSYREALASSLNAPAVRVAEQVGPDAVAALLGRLGITIPEREHGLAIALGGVSVRLVDLAAAYATLARGGEYLPWRVVARPEPKPNRVFSAETAFLVTDMLGDASARRLAFGLETPLELPYPVAAKTGTSQSFCDNLAVGYTTEVTVAVWAGNFDGRPMHSVLAMRGAAPLFRDVMRIAMEGRAARAFPRPGEIVDAEVCPLSGMRRGPHCPAGHLEPVDGRHTLGTCDWHDAKGLKMPAELLAFEDAPAGARALSRSEVVAIASPRSGDRFVIDSLLPRTTQSLVLEAHVAVEALEALEWLVDGRPVARGGTRAAAWPLVAGRHEVVAIATFLKGTERRTVRSRAATILVEASES